MAEIGLTPAAKIALALGADYVELANVQYYGWAMLNREQLLPSREQLIEAEAADSTPLIFRNTKNAKTYS